LATHHFLLAKLTLTSFSIAILPENPSSLVMHR
jgi:hypothetical protein